ncbi:hypothetical protein GcC1_068021 [Golovinomyces cichoracearum]|uniref:Uncharacterized protein n=1 Tax=Golovinomyces cichoracearum TaxID=62708 RepID=A0A420IQT9_9PEZI|nr:hypothetical protein GcC1_068021 [Golovinomyces cichoracearum]
MAKLEAFMAATNEIQKLDTSELSRGSFVFSVEDPSFLFIWASYFGQRFFVT